MPHLDEGTVHAWLDGALPPDEAARAEAHVASCADCAALVAEARGFIAASSRILAALDDVPGAVIPAARAAATGPALVPASPASAAPAVAAPARGSRPADGLGIADVPVRRPRPATRWSTRDWGLRAAAAVLVMVGGAALVLRETGAPTSASAMRDQVSTLSSPAAPPPAVPAAVPEAAPAAGAAAQSVPGTGAGGAVAQEAGGAAKDASARQATALMQKAIPARANELAANRAAAVDGAARRERRDAVRDVPASDVAPGRGTAATSGAVGAAAPLAPTAAPLPAPAAPPRVAEKQAAGQQAGVAGSLSGGLPQSQRTDAAAAPQPVTADAGEVRTRAASREQLDRLRRAPAVRTVEGWTRVSSSAFEQDGRLVRRTVYEVRPGVRVTLDEAEVVATVDEDARADRAGAAPADAAKMAAAPETAVNVLRWRSAIGTELSLSGPLGVRELEELRRLVP